MRKKTNYLLSVKSAVDGVASFTTSKTMHNLKAFKKGRTPKLERINIL